MRSVKLVTYVPYGAASQEAGVIYLLTNHLRARFADVHQLKCNGVFSLCDRDAETSWNRKLVSCSSCMAQQRELAQWANIGSFELSRFLSPKEVQASKRWILEMEAKDLLTCEFHGANLFSLVEGSFFNRFSTRIPDLNNKLHEQYLRRLLLASLRAVLASGRFFRTHQPELSLLAGGDDFLSKSYLLEVLKRKGDILLFKWEASARSIRIKQLSSGQEFLCGFILEDVTTMRPDPQTWPNELTSIVEEIVTCFGLAESQVRLPVAQ